MISKNQFEISKQTVISDFRDYNVKVEEQHTDTIVASVKAAAKTNGIFLHSFVFRLREVVRVICLR